jgi:3-hydroxybutyryl-CoA dehydrogenase
MIPSANQTPGSGMIQTICIAGAGTMGSGIAQVTASAGLQTLLFDVDASMIEKAKASIAKNLQTLVDKNRMDAAERQSILSRLQFTSQIGDCTADLLIEAIVENIDEKANLFNQLAVLNGNESIFATNTSSLSVSSIAKKTNRPERVIGMHFFNPPPLMKLVEVINTSLTHPDITPIVAALCKRLDKTPVICRDAPGFIVNRVARPYYIESLRLVEEGIADFATIDGLLEASGFRMGPFRLMDLIGNDINYAVSCSVYEALDRPPRLRPSLIQQQKVERGELGKKTGKGYYSYP